MRQNVTSQDDKSNCVGMNRCLKVRMELLHSVWHWKSLSNRRDFWCVMQLQQTGSAGAIFRFAGRKPVTHCKGAHPFYESFRCVCIFHMGVSRTWRPDRERLNGTGSGSMRKQGTISTRRGQPSHSWAIAAWLSNPCNSGGFFEFVQFAWPWSTSAPATHFCMCELCRALKFKSCTWIQFEFHTQSEWF